jgi:hypothetical protein
MSAKVITTVSKKIPIAGLDFSSVSASCTVEAEISDLSQVADQARALYHQAEAAVDEQLHLAAPGSTCSPQQHQQIPARQLPGTSANPSQQRQVQRQPSIARPAPRRGIPLISDAQRRLLDRLLDGDHQRADAVCQQAGVATIADLNMRQASEAIDRLKALVPA